MRQASQLEFDSASDQLPVTGPGSVTPAQSLGKVSHRGTARLVLSLFPGVDLLGRGFEIEGFSVVRGPDILWGQDIRHFSPASHAFMGIIGGSPCQDFSGARRTLPTGEGLELLGEYARCVREAAPNWFLLENVPRVPDIAPMVPGYTVQRLNIKASEVGCRQARLRCLQFGWCDALGPIVIRRVSLEPGASHGLLSAAMASEGSRKHRRSWADFCELQGLPRDFDLPGLSVEASYRAVGNGVPVPLARAAAVAISRRRVTRVLRLCVCECGREVPSGRAMANAACRKRMQRRRDAAVASDGNSVTGGIALL